jgi:hypothetical protein
MEAEQQLQRLGIDEILVYCVNDGAVMKGWQESFKLEDDDYVKLLGDPAGSFTRQLGLEMDSHPGPVGVGIIGRSKAPNPRPSRVSRCRRGIGHIQVVATGRSVSPSTLMTALSVPSTSRPAPTIRLAMTRPRAHWRRR